MTTRDIARVCHEVNRAYCKSIGDDTQLPWLVAPMWQQNSAIQGVQFHLQNPTAGPKGSHENWLKTKESEGWKYGPLKDISKKEHPCMVPYYDLPSHQQTKDHLFVAVVESLKDQLR